MQTDKQATAAKLDYAVDIRETTRSWRASDHLFHIQQTVSLDTVILTNKSHMGLPVQPS